MAALARAAHVSRDDDLTARGVEFTQEPLERPYGIDAAFRHPFGNPFRITQR